MLNRFFRLFIKSNQIVNSFQKYEKYFQSDVTTILLNFSNLRFDLPHKLEDRKYVTIGSKGLINANFIFETEKGEVIIGNNVHMGGVTIISRTKVEIHDDVTMAWGITIYDHNSHSIYWENRKNDNHQCYADYITHNGNNVMNKDWSNVISEPIIIQSKVWVGFNVIILKGVTIGEGAVVAAGSVVTKDVPAWTVVAGNPAMVVKKIER